MSGKHQWFDTEHDEQGNERLAVRLRGALLHSTPILNKGTAFPQAEREELGLLGLLPPQVCEMREQAERALAGLRRVPDPLSRYLELAALQDRNETLYYHLLLEHLEEMLPIVYTPTVGLACQQFGHIFRRGRGLYITAQDRGRIDKILENWPARDVEVLVVTDGERILGLGDLGASGMGIPIGKLALYVAGAGIHPAQTLPVCLDVGTNNKTQLEDPLYLGLRHKRLRGAEYDELLEEFVEAVTRHFPRAIVQFEDFGANNAFRLLTRYRGRYRCFNDDIQGTAAVVTAGVIAALRQTGGRLSEQRFVLAGAGSASTGIASLLAAAMREEGTPEARAVEQFWMLDSQGLVHAGRGELAEHKAHFVRTREEAERIRELGGSLELASVVHAVKPTMLIGATGQPNLFGRELLAELARHVEKPVVFALSNPTSKCECTPQEAFEATNGRALVATGSPFAPVAWEGRSYPIGQANNVFIFPGVGLGVLVSGATRIPDAFFLAAAHALAGLAPEGALYPSIHRLREASRAVAIAVADEAIRQGLAPASAEPTPARVERAMWRPLYLPYRPA